MVQHFDLNIESTEMDNNDSGGGELQRMTKVEFHHQNKFRITLFNYKMALEIDDITVREFESLNASFSLFIKPGFHKFLIREKLSNSNVSRAKSNVVMVETFPGQTIHLFSAMRGVFNVISKKIRCTNWELSLSPVRPLRSKILVGNLLRSKLPNSI